MDFDMTTLEDWWPMEPGMGPPLPRMFNIYWPWYHPEQTEFTCPTCGAKFPSQAALNEHMESVHNQPPVYECSVCGATFGSQAELDQHVTSVHGQPPPTYECSYCGQSFSSQAELNDHIASVHNQPPTYACPICGAEFPSQAALETHIASAHPNPPPAQPFIYSNPSAELVWSQAGSSWMVINFACDITNPNQVAVTKKINVMFKYYMDSNPSNVGTIKLKEFTQTLQPGETVHYSLPGDYYDTNEGIWYHYIGIQMHMHACEYLEDEGGGKSAEVWVYRP